MEFLSPENAVNAALVHIADSRDVISAFISVPELAASISEYCLDAELFETAILTASYKAHYTLYYQGTYPNWVHDCETILIRAENKTAEKWRRISSFSTWALYVSGASSQCQRSLCYYTQMCTCRNPLVFPTIKY